MNIVGWIELGIVLYTLQWIVVWMGLGLATRFDIDCFTAMKWAAGWPILLLYKFVKLIYQGLIPWVAWFNGPRCRTEALAKRCDEQHAAYIEGLMTESDDLYAKGFYGDYPPVKEFTDAA
jgi:hypothetical protein